MLKKDSGVIRLLLVFLASCNINQTNNIELNYLNTSKQIIGTEDYNRIYNKSKDSINFWVINMCNSYIKFSKTKNYFLDSLMCFNSNKDRFVCALLEIDNMDVANSDGITVFYGEEIKSNWYFFQGSYFIIPRETYKDQNIHTPLSYQQLHQAALKNIYSGYLKNGQINEAWFTEHFEHIGWGDFNHQEYDDWCFKGKRYSDISEYYKATHLCKVKGNWASRDTTQPLVPLPAKNLP